MPKRSTHFQTVVRFVREQWAEPGVTVTESKMLRDAHLGELREVDVVVEGTFDGEPSTTSIEITEEGRAASIEWVEREIAKHRYLPTNQLVLVSKSGFTKNASVAVAAEGGRVTALTPETVEVDGQPVIRTFFVELIRATPAICQLMVQRPDGTSLVVTAEHDYAIYDSEGVELGSAEQLAREVQGLEWLFKEVAIEAHNHPERESVRSFFFGLPIWDLGYHLRSDSDEMQRIGLIHLGGAFEWSQSELPLALTQLGRRRFESGKTIILGQPVVFVMTSDEQTKTAKVSWGTPGVQPAPGVEPRFVALRQMAPIPTGPIPIPLPDSRPGSNGPDA